jgi:hypothetical protein
MAQPLNDIAKIKDITKETEKNITVIGLPTEIREQIWGYLLTAHTGFIKPFRSGRRKGSKLKLDFHAVDPKPKDRYGNYTQFYKAGEQIRLDILCTASKIYHECAYVFWQTNTFILHSDDFFMVPSLLKESGLSTSFFRNIKHVHLDIDVLRHRPTPRDLDNCNRRLDRALKIAERMADPEEGTLKTLSIKPIGRLENVENVLNSFIMYGQEHMKEYQKIRSIFKGVNENRWLAEVKRRVQIDTEWDEMTATEQRTWEKEYASVAGTDMLGYIAEFMGDETWVNGKLCYENVEGKTERREDPFPLKDLEEDGRDALSSLMDQL